MRKFLMIALVVLMLILFATAAMPALAKHGGEGNSPPGTGGTGDGPPGWTNPVGDGEMPGWAQSGKHGGRQLIAFRGAQ